MSDLAGITPDLLCLAKGFSGGMFPMAATLATRTVFDAFLEPDPDASWSADALADRRRLWEQTADSLYDL